MKYITPFFKDKRGEIGTIAVLIGMVVVGLGILVGSQLRNQNINIAPRATASADPLWKNIKPGKVNNKDIYPWTNGGPTSGWESFIGNQVNICNGEVCWTLDRSSNPPTILNNGSPRILSQDSSFNTTKAAPDGTTMWSQGGPTAAWTVIGQSNGHTINETAVCNKNYCWRYLRYPNGVAGSGWRDGGAPIYLPTANDVWKDSRVASLFNGDNYITVAWSDPVNNNLAVCSRSNCRSLNFKNWTWNFNGERISPFPSGVSQFTSAWTSPATNVVSLCTANLCQLFDIGRGSYTGQTLLDAPTSAPTVPTTSSLRIGIVERDSSSNYNKPTVAVYKLNTNQKIGDCSESSESILGRNRVFMCNNLEPRTAYTVKAVYTPKNTNNPTITAQLNPSTSAAGVTIAVHDITVTFGYKIAISPTTPIPGDTAKVTISGTKMFTPVAQLTVSGSGPNKFSLTGTTELEERSTSFSEEYSVYVPAAGTYTVSVSVAEGYKAQIPSTKLTYSSFKITIPQPCIPTLSGPANNATVSSNPTFSWTGCSGKYWIEVKDGNTIVATATTTGTSAQISNPKWANGKSYTWTVKICPNNADCVGGTPSAPRTFKYQTSAPSTPTNTATPKPTNTTVVTQCPIRSNGDANCDNIINYIDFICWRGELIGSKPANCNSADFTGEKGTPDGVVNSLDYNIWRKTFLDPLNK